MSAIAALYRHPIKGLSPEEISEATLDIDGFFPGDRLFALENGPSGFDPAAPAFMPKIKFLMLMRNETLARLATRFDPATGELEIRRDGALLAEGNLHSAEGRAAIEAFFEADMPAALRGPVRLLAAPHGFRFMDSRSGFVSILNRATINAIAAAVGRAELDPRRFRGNILMEGLEAFAENELVGRRFSIGAVRFETIKRIERCAATDVDPVTGQRDIGMVAALEKHFGHHDCGIYARIITPGTIRIGDALTPLD